MGDLPLHPSVVHVPLGVAMVIPLLALWALAGSWRGAGPSRWGLVAVLQVVVIGGGFYAMSLGKLDEERVKRVVPEHAIEAHEDAAEHFVWSGVVALVLSVAAFSTRQRAMRWLAVAATAAAIITAGLGVIAGERGGRLVFRYDAARAHIEARGGPPPVPAAEQQEHDDD